MKKRIALLLIGVALAFNVSVAAKNAPNVILILTDDQGYGDMSCTGNPVLKTPHLDKLQQQSVSFTDFHVAAMCTPTRGMLMTGVDALKNGATGVTSGLTLLRRAPLRMHWRQLALFWVRKRAVV